ncbi:hypothetical protein PPSIR1_16430 [Plesiocystis pacifica SIR-1]|uniref:Uncharacterized protein n=1 Tax=Plesiocystis pacifica SIR-1 TaxID=391625 RepID=A6G341_9BACT|nr:RHS repeat-associated core domain-containing protein [Plesiocystis pacifica]EDM79666.1 hypothetical protein PPSIR1_16430 [Plesiocystis pacifica SIR-1]
MRRWDSRGHRFRVTYDTLHRPVDRFVSHAGAPEQLLGRTVYGDSLPSPEATNHRGRVYRVYDGAGVATTEAFDFKGLALSETRQLVLDPKTTPDWSPLTSHATVDTMASAAAPLLDAETFSASSQRDALGRTIEAISPDGSRTRYAYDQGGGLRQVTLEPRGATPAQTVVGDITYDAKGQRLQVVYGPAASPTTTTDYAYDPQTYRLTRLKTTRGSDSERLQSLHYHYDPAGNITDIRDTAQQTVFFQNTVVEAANSYTYDAVGRLIEATGREHASQGTAQRTHAQLPVGPQPMTSDPSAMRRYTQRYTYDPAGNILKLQHLPSSGTGWTRHYAYATDGNRLLSTSAPGDLPNPGGGPYSHSYTYDAHGSMVTMPHLPAMTWNPLDQLQHATAGTQEVYFQYAGGSNRSRKFTEHAGGTTEERIYLGPFELYRKRINGQLDLERETLHVSDGTGRICVVETKTADAGTPVPSPTPMWRFQLSNHLGSTATEVTETGAVISHEEYHPYGTSAYRSVDSSIDVSARRYRYTGMERDEETALSYHSSRYYASWLARWISADSLGRAEGMCRYRYVRNSPPSKQDLKGQHEYPVTRSESETYAHPAAANYEGEWVPISEDDSLGWVYMPKDLLEQPSDVRTGRPSERSADAKTDGQYEAEAIEELENELDSEDAQHYDRPLIVEFIPWLGLYDIKHDAAQMGAAWQLGDEDRFGRAARSVLFDIGSMFIDTATLGADRLVIGGSRSLSKGTVLSAKGVEDVGIAEGKAAIREGEGAGAKATSSAGEGGRAKAHENSAGETVDRELVKDEDALLQVAEDAAGGSLDNFREMKPNGGSLLMVIGGLNLTLTGTQTQMKAPM